MAQPQAFSWKNSRILIADDEPDMREIFSAWFLNLGCIVSEAADGKEALDALARDRFDAIVTDVRMPRVDGVQLVHQLHRSGNYPYTPVIIFVSGCLDLTLPDTYDIGVEAILSKPCEKKELINAVQKSLQRRDLNFEPLSAVAPPAAENYIREAFPRGVTSSQVAVGRGGISVDVDQCVTAESIVGFSLSFAEGTLTHLQGWGFLRWCQNSPGICRIGIELLHLDEESLVQFARWLKDYAPISFIPKDCHSRSKISSSA